VKVKIESMDEHSQAKIYKSKPDLSNGDVNADCFYSLAETFKSVASRMEFGYDKPRINRHATAIVSWYLCFQLRILDVTQIYF